MTFDNSAATAKAILAIRGLSDRPFVGSGCCVRPGADVLREELERFPTIANANVDAMTGEATLELSMPLDIDPIYEMLEDLGYSGELISSDSIERRLHI